MAVSAKGLPNTVGKAFIVVCCNVFHVCLDHRIVHGGCAFDAPPPPPPGIGGGIWRRGCIELLKCGTPEKYFGKIFVAPSP